LYWEKKYSTRGVGLECPRTENRFTDKGSWTSSWTKKKHPGTTEEDVEEGGRKRDHNKRRKQKPRKLPFDFVKRAQKEKRLHAGKNGRMNPRGKEKQKQTTVSRGSSTPTQNQKGKKEKNVRGKGKGCPVFFIRETVQEKTENGAQRRLEKEG